MKIIRTILPLLFIASAATFSTATNNIQQVQHVIVIIQENRTPTNLFQQDTTLINNGGHIVPVLPNPDECGNQPTLQPTGLFTCWDTGHHHAPDWTKMWDEGKMDGACEIGINTEGQDGAQWCKTKQPCVIKQGNQVCSARRRRTSTTIPIATATYSYLRPPAGSGSTPKTRAQPRPTPMAASPPRPPKRSTSIRTSTRRWPTRPLLL